MIENAQHDDQVPSLQGTVADLATPEKRNCAFGLALDYRGDVTVKITGGNRICGYIFDRNNTDADDPYVRIISSDDSACRKIYEWQIQAMDFTGRDTAAGKNWRAWAKHYQEKKATGESTDLHPDRID